MQETFLYAHISMLVLNYLLSIILSQLIVSQVKMKMKIQMIPDNVFYSKYDMLNKIIEYLRIFQI